MSEPSSKSRMIEVLYNHYQFQECILEDVKWKRGGAELDLVFDYVWPDCNGFLIDEKGQKSVKPASLRADLDTPLLKTLHCEQVQEFSVHNYLNDHDIKHPEQTDWGWGFSEIALIEIPDDNGYLAKYRHHPGEFHHLCVLWENDRRIDIVCGSITVL